MDCIPPTRRLILDYLLVQPGTETQIANAGPYSAALIGRELQNLRAHEVLACGPKKVWSVADYWAECWSQIHADGPAGKKAI